MRSRSSRALIAVGAVHILLVIALAHAAPNVKSVREDAPIEVLYLSDQSRDATELPPPPKAQLEPARLDTVIAPTLDVAAPDPRDSTAITVRLADNVPAQPAAGVPKLVSSIEYLRAPAPKYPKSARSLGQRGLVIVRALIDVNGRATQVIVHRSAGYAALDEAARTAVLEASFKPYLENGQPQPAFVLIPIEFDPSRSG